MKQNVTAKQCIAVFGGAVRFTPEQIIAAFKVGMEIANREMSLITGGTSGVPYAAAVGASYSGGLVIGISPGNSASEHIEKYKKPLDSVNAMIYTGMGFEGRNPINVRSAKGAIFIGGEFGTLNEFAAAFTVGNNVLGVLENHGGISDQISNLIPATQTNYGSIIIIESDPVRLAHLVCEEVNRRFSQAELQTQNLEIGSDVREIIRTYLDKEAKHNC